MNLLCHWCGVSFSEVPWARTFFPCDHKLCRPCYYHERQPRMCFLCPPKPVMSASKGGLPEIHNRHPQPPPPTPKSLNVNLLPDTCSVNATHPSTSEDHTTSMTGFRSSAHKEDSRQSTDDSGDTNQRLSNAQQREQDRVMGQPGIVSLLREKFESGGFTSQEGAAGWKSHMSKKNLELALTTIRTSSQQEFSGSTKDPHTPHTVADTHNFRPSKGQKSLQSRTAKHRNSAPYPPSPPTDPYLGSPKSREPSPGPPRSRNTSSSSPSPSSTSKSSPCRSRMLSSSLDGFAHNSNFTSKSKEEKDPSLSPSIRRDPSPSSSIRRDPSPTPSIRRDPSPTPSIRRDPSPSSRRRNPSLSRSRDPSPSPATAWKAPPAPSRPTAVFHIIGKDTMIPGRAMKEGSGEGVAHPCPPTTQHPHIKLPLTPTMLKPYSTTAVQGRSDAEVGNGSGGGSGGGGGGGGGGDGSGGDLPQEKHHHHSQDAPPHTLNQSLREEGEEEEAFKQRITAEFFHLHGIFKERWEEFLSLKDLQTQNAGLQEEVWKLNVEQGQKIKEKSLEGELQQYKERERAPQHEVEQLREGCRALEEELKRKQELQKSSNESNQETETLKQAIRNLTEKLEFNKKEKERMEMEWAQMKAEYDLQQNEVIALKEKDRKNQDSTWVREQSVRQGNEALVKELSSTQEQLGTVIQNNKELMGEVRALRDAKAKEEKEVLYWKEEHAKQQKVTQQVVKEFKMQQQRLQQYHVDWEERIIEMQTQINSREQEKEELRGKNNKLQNELQRLTEDLAKCNEVARQLRKEKEHCQLEKGRHEEELKDLRQEESAKGAKLVEVQKLYQEEREKLKATEENLKRLMLKDLQNQEELAAFRSSEETIRSLIRERDSCQEEIDKLRKEETTRKRTMEHLRKEKEDCLMKIHQLENKNLQLPRKLNEKYNALLVERNELMTQKTTLEEEVTQLRAERDNYKNTVDSLGQRVDTELTRMRRERDQYRAEADKLTEKEISHVGKMNELNSSESKRNTELLQEIDNLNGVIDQMRIDKDSHRETLAMLENKEVAREEEIKTMERERDGYRESLAILEDKDAAREEEMKTIEREKDSLRAQLRDMKRDRDYYEDERNRLKSSEAEVNRIIQMMTERNESGREEEAENSKLAQQEQEIQNYKQIIEDYKEKENVLKKQILEMEKENEQRSTGALTEQLRRERDDNRDKIQELMTGKEELRKQLMETATERDNCRRELDRHIGERYLYRQTADELTRRNSKLENEIKQVTSERDSCIRDRHHFKAERDNLKKRIESNWKIQSAEIRRMKEEIHSLNEQVENNRKTYSMEIKRMNEENHSLREMIEQGKKTSNTQVTKMRGESEPREQAAEGLSGRTEVGLWSPAASGGRKVMQPRKSLGDALTPIAPVEAVKEVEVVTLGLEMEVDEDKEKSMAEEVVTQGLPNLGNTCYINSVVQCLLHLPALRKTLAQYSRLQHQCLYQQGRQGTGVAVALAQLFGAMQSANETMVRLSAREFKQVLGSHDEAFRGKQQHEAHDLFASLVSWLQSDLKQYEALNPAFCSSSLFSGTLETKMMCPRNTKPLTHTQETFTSLSLPVVGADSWDLLDLLDKYFKEQTMEWDCHHCRFTHKCYHHMHVIHLPPLLVIHFSRVPEFRSTRKAKINFPMSELSLQRYMAPGSPLLPRYTLVGVACHEGSMHSGHYIAYCRVGRGNKWRHCNDSLVGNIRPSGVLDDENAHLLFYVQQ